MMKPSRKAIARDWRGVSRVKFAKRSRGRPGWRPALMASATRWLVVSTASVAVRTAYLYALRTASQEPCQHQCVSRNRARRGFSIHHSQPVTLTQSFRCGDEVLTIEDFHNPLQGQVRTFRITWLDVFCRDLLDLGE